MPLDPQVKTLLEQMNRSGVKPLSQLTPQEARDQMLLGSRFLGPSDPVQETIDYVIDGPGGQLPLRLYRPSDQQSLPVLVYFHGGGWIMGNINTHDGFCRALCRRAGICIVSVDYRLAPENKFPAGLKDCYAATKWVAENCGRLGLAEDRIAVGGDSAGGNLAAAVSLMARDRSEPTIQFQLLIYPVLDFDFSRRSYIENSEGFHLTRQDMIRGWGDYLVNEKDGYSPLASPLRADKLAGLPPAHIISAEFDPLRDEAAEYARRLAAAKVTVTYECYEGMIHGFARRVNQLDRARLAMEEIASALRAALID